MRMKLFFCICRARSGQCCEQPLNRWRYLRVSQSSFSSFHDQASYQTWTTDLTIPSMAQWLTIVENHCKDGWFSEIGTIAIPLHSPSIENIMLNLKHDCKIFSGARADARPNNGKLNGRLISLSLKFTTFHIHSWISKIDIAGITAEVPRNMMMNRWTKFWGIHVSDIPWQN